MRSNIIRSGLNEFCHVTCVMCVTCVMRVLSMEDACVMFMMINENVLGECVRCSSSCKTTNNFTTKKKTQRPFLSPSIIPMAHKPTEKATVQSSASMQSYYLPLAHAWNAVNTNTKHNPVRLVYAKSLGRTPQLREDGADSLPLSRASAASVHRSVNGRPTLADFSRTFASRSDESTETADR